MFIESTNFLIQVHTTSLVVNGVHMFSSLKYMHAIGFVSFKKYFNIFYMCTHFPSIEGTDPSR